MKPSSPIICLLLTIFCSGCLDSEDNSNPLGLDTASGTSTALEPYCNQVGRVDPIQVPKHELPQPLQFFRDYCTNLVRLRTEEFNLSDSDPLQCDFIWADLSESDLLELNGFLDAQLGAPSSIQVLMEQGDIYSSDRGTSLIIEIMSSNDAKYYWQQDLLWPHLSSPLGDFESLVWRLNMQEPVDGVCNSKTKWEQVDGNFFLNSYRTCQGSTALKVDFTLGESGTLISRKEESLGEDPSCPIVQ